MCMNLIIFLQKETLIRKHSRKKRKNILHISIHIYWYISDTYIRYISTQSSDLGLMVVWCLACDSLSFRSKHKVFKMMSWHYKIVIRLLICNILSKYIILPSSSNHVLMSILYWFFFPSLVLWKLVQVWISWFN